MAINLQDGWWYNGSQYTDRPWILNYSYGSPRVYGSSDPSWWTWATYAVWSREGMSILFVNLTDDDLKITKTGIKSVSCNSNGRNIVSYNSMQGYIYLDWTANGAGCDFSCYYRACNDMKNINFESLSPEDVVSNLNSSGHTWTQSNAVTVSVPEVDFDNMNNPGRVGSGPSSSFGEDPNYPENGRFIAREYTFTDSPIIEANGGICTLHVDVHVGDQSTSFPGVPFIRVLMDPKEMEILFEQEIGPYIWRMTNGVWVLKKPLRIFNGASWADAENAGGNQ